MMKLNTVLLLPLISIAIGQPETCSREGTVKLAAFNSNDLHAGIVEVCHDGYWGTICTDSLTHSWSEKNAHIACLSVVDPGKLTHPYSGALNSIILSTLPDSYKVPESVPIHYISVVCDGTEQNFGYCSQISTNTINCTHDYDAAVVCRKGSTYDDVRLVGSVNDGQGAVEMNVAGYGWVRLCPDAFDLSGVCNKLGYTSTTYQNYVISTNGLILTKLSLTTVCVTKYHYVDNYDYYSGYYNDYSYYSSYYSYYNKRDVESYQSCTTQYTTKCDYADNLYAGVTCSNTGADGSVRLYGGSDAAIGNVEVLYNGVWGAVCATGWNEDAGRLVCAQLGYDPNDDYISIGFTGSYSGQNYLKPIWLNNVSNCSHLTNKKIAECSYTPPIGYGQGCSSANVATLQCDYVWTDGAIAGVVLGSIFFVVGICITFCISYYCCKYMKNCRGFRRPRTSPRSNPVLSNYATRPTQSGLSSNNSTSRPSLNSLSQPRSSNESQDVETCFSPAAAPSGAQGKETKSFAETGAPPAYDESKKLPSCVDGSLPAYELSDSLPAYEDDKPYIAS